MDIGAIKSASKDIDDGQWVDSEAVPGVRLKVRGLTSAPAIKALGRAQRTAPDEMRDEAGEITDAAQSQIDLDIIATVILLDWDGLTDNGKPVEYSEDVARDFVSASIFEAAVRSASLKVTQASHDRLEKLMGNSSGPSKPSKETDGPQD